LKISRSVFYRLLKEANVNPENYRGVTKAELTDVLRKVQGIRRAAAKELDVSYATIKLLIRKFDFLPPPRQAGWGIPEET